MSRSSDAKKARRKRRRAAQNASWISEPTFDRMMADENGLDGIDEAVADIDDFLASRGWVLDDDHGVDHLVSWVYPPSATTFDDTDLEPVTRVWITLLQDPDEVVIEFGAALVGSGAGDVPYVLDPDTLADCLAALESYRPGLSRPVFA